MAKRRSPKLAERERKPFPCPSCRCEGAILIATDETGSPVDLEREGAARWRCSQSCGYDVPSRDSGDGGDRCPADGSPVVFDPTVVGDTVGGLTLRGWNRCDHCGGFWITRRGVPHTGGVGDGRWRLASSGRSLDAGGMRIRAEGRATEGVATLMARISRMPAFEEALERIASGQLDATAAAELAREALSIGDAAEEIES